MMGNSIKVPQKKLKTEPLLMKRPKKHRPKRKENTFNIIDQLDLPERFSHRKLYVTVEYILLSSAQGSFSRTNHRQGHTTKLNKFNKG